MFHLQLRKKWAETTLCLACHFLQITGCTSPGKTVSIVVRGSNKLVIEEAERSIHDALCVIRCLVKKRSVSYFWRVNFIVKKILNEPENIPLHAGSHGKVGLFKNTFRYSYRYLWQRRFCTDASCRSVTNRGTVFRKARHYFRNGLLQQLWWRAFKQMYSFFENVFLVVIILFWS